jgi:hypothetical protein
MLIQSLLLVWKHIESNGRRGKSVVTFSVSSGRPVDPNNLSPGRKEQKTNIKVLLDNDVPVFVAAGNHAIEKDKDGNINRRTNVDTAPGIFEGENYPLIVVGSVKFDGTPSPTSQAGLHVQLWAPGVAVSVQKKDEDGERIAKGTSYAAPLMAGMLATYLAYDTVPFDTSEGNMVAAAKNYLINKASWARAQSLNGLWNEVDEAHNPKKAAAAAATATPSTTTQTPTTFSSQLAPPIPTAPTAAPYAQGTCGIHVTQRDVDSNGLYDLEVLMTDNDHNQIGYTQPLGGNNGYSASNPLQFQSKLEAVLTCIPQKQNDYIQFYLGAQAWPSDGNSAPGAVPSCTVGGWDGDPSLNQYPVRSI